MNITQKETQVLEYVKRYSMVATGLGSREPFPSFNSILEALKQKELVHREDLTAINGTYSTWTLSDKGRRLLEAR
jgi:hypothetical protein